MDDLYTKEVINAFLEVIKSSSDTSQEQEQLDILKSLIDAGYFTTSRNPAPASITEVGGYLNLLEKQENKRMEFVNNLLGLSQKE